MQTIRLVPRAAKQLARHIDDVLEGPHGGHALEWIEISAGDVSGQPEGWQEFDFGTKFGAVSFDCTEE